MVKSIAFFDLQLNAAQAEELYEPSSCADISPCRGSLTFANRGGNLPEQLSTAEVVDDDLPEVEENFFLNLEAVTGRGRLLDGDQE